MLRARTGVTPRSASPVSRYRSAPSIHLAASTVAADDPVVRGIVPDSLRNVGKSDIPKIVSDGRG